MYTGLQIWTSVKNGQDYFDFLFRSITFQYSLTSASIFFWVFRLTDDFGGSISSLPMVKASKSSGATRHDLPTLEATSLRYPPPGDRTPRVIQSNTVWCPTHRRAETCEIFNTAPFPSNGNTVHLFIAANRIFLAIQKTKSHD
jgi:hypothetical protein